MKMPYRHKKTIYDKIQHEAGIWNYEFGTKQVELSDETLIECQTKEGNKENVNVTWKKLKATSGYYSFYNPAYFKNRHPVYSIIDPYGLVEWLYKEQGNKNDYQLCPLDTPILANIDYWL